MLVSSCYVWGFKTYDPFGKTSRISLVFGWVFGPLTRVIISKKITNEMKSLYA